MGNITKLYAAYKAGYLGNNIIDTYFSFIANIIIEEHICVIEDYDMQEKFCSRYGIEAPLQLIRQILGVGVKNNCFTQYKGKYTVNFEELSKFKFDKNEFDSHWKELLSDFQNYCKQIEVEISENELEEFILSVLDKCDDIILSGERIDEDEGVKPEEYAWFTFVKKHATTNSDLYSFISAISASNIVRQALFYIGDSNLNYSGLNIYLDSPIVFALLGMDEKSRTDSYKNLIAEIQNAGCNVQILDNNFQEIDGIIASAASWAISSQYDIRKANNATRFFHDSQMNEIEIQEFCENIESKLNEIGITIKTTNYDVYQQQFQEDEIQLYDMIRERYTNDGFFLLPEKEDSIRVDVRSIVMIYRERQGQTATRLSVSKHLMLTSNNTIANVCKKYESNRSINSGHIPACISADLFGAIMWLDSPIKLVQYQKQKLLADCYSFLKPNKRMMDKYIESLEEARIADQIDEKTFLFLRSHKVVLDSLMGITRGDYARFNSNTYIEVYNDIQAKARKEYEDEVSAHKQTKELLRQVENQAALDSEEKDQKIKDLNEKVDRLEEMFSEQREAAFEKKVSTYGWVITLCVFGIPYLIIFAITEILKSRFSQITWYSILRVAILLLAASIVMIAFKKGKQICFKFVRKYLNKHENTE